MTKNISLQTFLDVALQKSEDLFKDVTSANVLLNKREQLKDKLINVYDSCTVTSDNMYDIINDFYDSYNNDNN